MVGPMGPAAATRVTKKARAETILNCILFALSVILNTGNRLDEDNAKIKAIFIYFQIVPDRAR
jgi:hypothetical protein